jgi:hypothetical protein
MLVRARCCAFVIGNPSKLTAPATFANVLHGTARIGALDLYPPLLDTNIPNSVKCMYSGKIAVPPRRVVEG